MEFEMLRFAICIIGCALATYYDIFNRRNVPSWLTYGLVALGALFTLASFNLNVIEFNGLVALVIFAFGYVLYISGQIGGADVLIFVSIALLVPEAPTGLFVNEKSMLGLPFVVSIFVLSGVLAVFGIFLQYIPRTIRDVLSGEKVTINASQIALSVAILLFYGVFLYYIGGVIALPQPELTVFEAVVICATSIFALKDHISDKYLIRMIKVDEIDEEDVLAIEKMDPKLVSQYKLGRVLTPKEIEKLKKIGKNKKFPVYVNMPVFMPYVLLALIVALLMGDPLAYLYPMSLLS